VDKDKIQRIFEKACELAAKQTRNGIGNNIVVHPGVAEKISDALKMRERLMKIKKITERNK
jgi:hypothetical protein